MLHIFGICEEMYNFNFNGDLQKKQHGQIKIFQPQRTVWDKTCFDPLNFEVIATHCNPHPCLPET